MPGKRGVARPPPDLQPDLFGPTPPKQASPRLAKRIQRKLAPPRKGFLHTVLPEFHPGSVPEWSLEQQYEALNRYLAYVKAIALKSHWRGIVTLCEATEACLSATDALNAALDVHAAELAYGVMPDEAAIPVAYAQKRLNDSIRNARAACKRALSYMWQAPRKAELAEPLYHLLLGDSYVVGYFNAKTEVYEPLRQKNTAFWGRYNRYPRWFVGLGIAHYSHYWRQCLPRTREENADRFRTPLVRAQAKKKPLTATQKRKLMRLQLPPTRGRRVAETYIPD